MVQDRQKLSTMLLSSYFVLLLNVARTSATHQYGNICNCARKVIILIVVSFAHNCATDARINVVNGQQRSHILVYLKWKHSIFRFAHFFSKFCELFLKNCAQNLFCSHPKVSILGNPVNPLALVARGHFFVLTPLYDVILCIYN
jgi:hypothetical protein